MGAITKLNLLTKHFQYMGLLKKIDLPWPKKWYDFLSFPDLLNLDFKFLYLLIDGLPRITHRLMFIGVAVIFPLVLMVFTLLVFFSLYVIMWFCLTVFAVFLLVIWVIYQSDPGIIPHEFHAKIGSEVYFGMMITMLIVSIGAKFCKKLTFRAGLGLKPELFRDWVAPTCIFFGFMMMGFGEIVLKVVLGFCAVYLVLRVVVTNYGGRGFKVLMSLLFLGSAAYVISDVPIQHTDAHIPAEFSILGAAFTTIGCLQVVQSLLFSLNSKGSGLGKAFTSARNRIQGLLDTWLLALAFFALQAVFVPVVTYCLQFFLCSDYDCPLGTKFNPFAPRGEGSYDTGSDLFCDPCTFIGSCAYNVTQMCPAQTANRLLLHPDVPCDDKNHVFFLVSSTLVLLCFVIVMTIMYHKTIQTLTNTLKESAEVKLKVAQHKYFYDKQEYDIQVAERKIAMARNQLIVPQQPPRAAATPGGANRTTPPPAATAVAVANESDRELDDILFGEEDTADPLGLDAPLLPAGPAAGATVPDRAQAYKVDAGSPKRGAPAIGPEPKKPKQPTFDSVFEEVCQDSEPRASSLYQPFIFSFRFFALVDQNWRLVLVIVNVMVSPYTNWSTVLNFLMHTLMVVGLLGFQPYAEKMEQHLASILSVCDMCNALYTIFVWLSPKEASSDGVVITMIVLNLVIPIIAGIALWFVSVKNMMFDPRRKEMQKRKKEKAKKKAEIAARRAELEARLNGEINSPSSKKEGDGELSKTAQQIRAEEKAKAEAQKTPEEKLTEQLDKRTKTIVTQFFVYATVPLLVVAMGLTLFATLKEDAADNVLAVTSGTMYREEVFLGIPTFDEFVDHCCCFEARRPIHGSHLTERWVCPVPYAAPPNTSVRNITMSPIVLAAFVDSTRTVTRNRVVPGDFNDGRPLRDTCGRTFLNEGCTVRVVDPVLDRVALRCDPFWAPDTLDNKTVSSFAMDVLW